MDKTTRNILARTLLFIGTVVLMFTAGTLLQFNVPDFVSGEHRARFQELPDYTAELTRGGFGIPTEMLDTRLYTDVILHDGRIHMPFGPMPVALLLPFSVFRVTIFPTLGLTMLILLAAGLLMYRIARHKGMNEDGAVWLAVAYCFGSAILPLTIPIATSWMILLMANIFLLLALYSYLSKKSHWVTGTFLALATATRPVSAIGIFVYIALNEWSTKIYRKTTSLTLPRLCAREGKHFICSLPLIRGGGLGWGRFAALILPIIIAIFIIGAYNHLRFNDFTESGYRIQWQADPVLAERMTYGAMNARYIPQNLRYFLVEPPNIINRFPFVIPDAMGMGIIFGSPYILYVLFLAKHRWETVRPLAAAAIGLIPALTFFASGFAQIGYRYAVDIYPLLFLALIAVFNGKVPRPAKVLIVLSVITHIIWIATMLT
jgi:hypothetical protein